MSKEIKLDSNKSAKEFINSPVIKAMLESFVKMANQKNYEFVTFENGFSFHIGYKTENNEKIYFVLKSKDESIEKEVKQITEIDYEKICKGKLLAVSFFK